MIEIPAFQDPLEYPPAPDIEFSQCAANVFFDRFFRDAKDFSDLRVGQPLAGQRGYFLLAFGQLLPQFDQLEGIRSVQSIIDQFQDERTRFHIFLVGHLRQYFRHLGIEAHDEFFRI